MNDDRQKQNGQENPELPFIPSRRRILATAALTPVLPGVMAGTAHATARRTTARTLIEPVMTQLSDWTDVGQALGGPGDMKRFMYHTGLPRRDLKVYTRGVRVDAGLALGTHVSFVRYSDGSTLLMGDVVLTEQELQPYIDVLQQHGIMATAIHKHLLAQRPDIWWVHVHAHAQDPVTVAHGLRAAFDRTATPRPQAATTNSLPPLDMDTAAVDAAIGVPGSRDGNVYKSTFVRREKVTDGGHLLLPPGLGSTTSINYQPLGGGRVAINGDFVLVAREVQDALVGLRRAGIDLVELHHHNLTDEPRLFFVHYWAVGDAVQLAKALRPVVDATDVVPMAGVTG
ncbi:DUF1259 domain-containing protein [Streptomyces sp. NPDC001480]|uniref:DUF1259 domain-containing protein n=1 Tax=Streptomyces sp. NPDC001480 TaxID=3364577 RepID=UPI0036870F7E